MLFINKKLEGFFKVKTLLVLLVLAFSVGFYLFFINTRIVDKTYNFEFSNIQGWKKISPRENAYISLATVTKDRFVISYADVRLVENEMSEKFIDRMLSEDKTKTIEELCKQNKDVGMTFLSITRLRIPKTNSYKCLSEFNGGPNNLNKTMVFENYFYIRPKFNIIFSVTYRKDLPEEIIKVRNLVDGFIPMTN